MMMHIPQCRRCACNFLLWTVDNGTPELLVIHLTTLAHFFEVLAVNTKSQINITTLQLMIHLSLAADMALCGLLLNPSCKSVKNDTIRQFIQRLLYLTSLTHVLWSKHWNTSRSEMSGKRILSIRTHLFRSYKSLEVACCYCISLLLKISKCIRIINIGEFLLVARLPFDQQSLADNLFIYRN